MLTRSTITKQAAIFLKGDAMGLFKRKCSKCWQMCFFLEGKKVRKSTSTTNKKVALRIYDRTKGQIAESTYRRANQNSMPFYRLVEEFLKKHSNVEKASHKRDFYSGQNLKKYFNKIPIGKISSLSIKEWRQWRSKQKTYKGTPVKNATINRELSMLKTMLNFAVEWEWLEENPAERIKKLRGEESRLRILSKEEIGRLMEESVEHLMPILIIALSTGMRKGEILKLTWKHVDFQNRFIRVVNGKNGEARNVPMNAYLESILQDLKKKCTNRDGYVFTRRNGERIRSIKDAFTAACKRAGIEDFRFHDLRHTAASLLAAGGCDIITLQHVLGHKTLAMTQRYAHLIPDRYQKTREIMQNFWEGDTISDTVIRRAKEMPLSH